LDHPNILGAMAGLLAGVPRIVLSFRNYNPTHFSYLDNDWLRDYYRAVIRSPRVTLTGNSNLANDDYAKWLGIDPKSVTLIPNAIDEVDFEKPTQDELFRLMEQLGIVPGTPIVLGIFRLSEEKQPLLFLDICAELIAAYPGLRVLIVGVGPMQQEVQQYIERLGLVRNVSLLGRRTDVSSLMRISRFLLLTSSREGMPNVLMEAQLLGLPVVATRIGGVPNCVRHGITGFLENVGDVKALTKACLSLLSNPEQAAHMGLAGTAWMRDFFTRSQMARRFVDIAEIETAQATKDKLVV
jgi:glycosyltransferase involved in cell wall biosynthesis